MHWNDQAKIAIKCKMRLLTPCVSSGYEGDGKTCTQADICSTNNGGCYPLATCTSTPGTRTHARTHARTHTHTHTHTITAHFYCSYSLQQRMTSSIYVITGSIKRVLNFNCCDITSWYKRYCCYMCPFLQVYLF